MKIIRKNIEPLINSISLIQKNPEWKGVERAYVLLKIRKALETSLLNIKELEKNSPEVDEFFRKRNDILVSFAQKNDDGTPKIENNSYVLIEKEKEICFSDLKKLEEEYKEHIDKENEKRKDLVKFMGEFEYIDIDPFQKNLIPENVLPEDLWNIKDIIEEEIIEE